MGNLKILTCFLLFGLYFNQVKAQVDTTKTSPPAEIEVRSDSLAMLSGELPDKSNFTLVYIMELLIDQAPEFQVFVKALNNADFVSLLSDTNHLTVFAPTNISFSNLEGGNIDELLLQQNLPALQRLVTTHIIAGEWSPDSIRAEVERRGGDLQLPSIGEGGDLRFSLEGSRLLLIDPQGNQVYLNDSVRCRNGRVYKINTVLKGRVE